MSFPPRITNEYTLFQFSEEAQWRRVHLSEDRCWSKADLLKVLGKPSPSQEVTKKKRKSRNLKNRGFAAVYGLKTFPWIFDSHWKTSKEANERVQFLRYWYAPCVDNYGRAKNVVNGSFAYVRNGMLIIEQNDWVFYVVPYPLFIREVGWASEQQRLSRHLSRRSEIIHGFLS